MPPKSLINFAPLKPTQHKKVATKHAIAPWFGEGMRGGSLGLWWSLNGKLVALLSLEHLSCILREEIPVVGLFPALFFHVSEESSRSLPLMRGWESGKTFSFTFTTTSVANSLTSAEIFRTCLCVKTNPNLETYLCPTYFGEHRTLTQTSRPNVKTNRQDIQATLTISLIVVGSNF